MAVACLVGVLAACGVDNSKPPSTTVDQSTTDVGQPCDLNFRTPADDFDGSDHRGQSA